MGVMKQEGPREKLKFNQESPTLNIRGDKLGRDGG